MIPQAFLADLEAKPATLRSLADLLADDPWAGLDAAAFAGRRRVVLLGMGSSAYASGVVAARLRAAGADAVSVLASTDLLPAADADTLVVAVSAGGGSRETTAAVDHYRAQAPVVLLTNKPGSELAARCDVVVPMHAGEETGGVACRSFQHTLLLLLAMAGRFAPEGADVARLARAAADASEDLLARRDVWLPRLRDRLLGPDGTYVVAPSRRWASAQQSALMLREGPRRAAVACETGDWSHVDVYLTKTLDYRMLLLAGSRWEDELLQWTTERGSTVVALGAEVPGVTDVLRYTGDGDDDVRLVSEVLVAELLAADAWLNP